MCSAGMKLPIGVNAGVRVCLISDRPGSATIRAGDTLGRHAEELQRQHSLVIFDFASLAVVPATTHYEAWWQEPEDRQNADPRQIYIPFCTARETFSQFGTSFIVRQNNAAFLHSN